jgi:hypothetical protein
MESCASQRRLMGTDPSGSHQGGRTSKACHKKSDNCITTNFSMLIICSRHAPGCRQRHTQYIMECIKIIQFCVPLKKMFLCSRAHGRLPKDTLARGFLLCSVAGAVCKAPMRSSFSSLLRLQLRVGPDSINGLRAALIFRSVRPSPPRKPLAGTAASAAVNRAIHLSRR